MTRFSSYALQLVNFSAASLAATGAELLIVESGVTGAEGLATLSVAELAGLAAQGRTVVGYVNTSVTDHVRAYWNAAWVTPDAPDEPDVGTLTSLAPAWLANNLGMVDFAPDPMPTPEAILVDYRDPAWRAIVVAEAVAVVQAGFKGVFLDDVGRYFEAGHFGPGAFDPTLADAMMSLVIEVAAAIRAVDAQARVIVNSGVYIGGDSSAGLGGALFASYLAALDGVLIENQFASETDPAPPDVLSTAASSFPGVDILPLENRASGISVEAFLAFAGETGMLPYLSPDETYALFARTPQMGSAADDTLSGTTGVTNLMAGLAGNDMLRGAQLADELYGHDGDDSLAGGLGADRASGGAGRDVVSGHGGNDRLFGGAGEDRLFGGAGNDRLFGGSGNDRLFGESGDDVFVFAGRFGRDRIVDFDPAHDQIDLSAFSLNFAAVMSASTRSSTGLVIDLRPQGAGVLVLEGGLQAADLAAGDFLL